MNTILGLDIGGANLKAASTTGEAVSVPFALWKHPEKLPAALAELLAKFDGVRELAVTMTGELCDCFETKQQGVQVIVAAMQQAAGAKPVRYWTTRGEFVNASTATEQWLSVAAANWHALATFVGTLQPHGVGLLVDTGTTTTDIIPVVQGQPRTLGLTDPDRLFHSELVYTGVKRTPLCALLPAGVHAAEFFATSHDAYLVTGDLPEEPSDTDTADNRPATRANAHARISRMLGGDLVLIPESRTTMMAAAVASTQRRLICTAIEAALSRLAEWSAELPWVVVSGSGEFLARQALEPIAARFGRMASLTEQLGTKVATGAPAFAVAKLASEAAR